MGLQFIDHFTIPVRTPDLAALARFYQDHDKQAELAASGAAGTPATAL